eukprot:13785418-Heterocapsa_arctica.AAC.1
MTDENKRSFEAYVAIKGTREPILDLAMGKKHTNLTLEEILNQDEKKQPNSEKAMCIEVSDGFVDLVSLSALRALTET